jgi:hypothetical protein
VTSINNYALSGLAWRLACTNFLRKSYTLVVFHLLLHRLPWGEFIFQPS